MISSQIFVNIGICRIILSVSQLKTLLNIFRLWKRVTSLAVNRLALALLTSLIGFSVYERLKTFMHVLKWVLTSKVKIGVYQILNQCAIECVCVLPWN